MGEESEARNGRIVTFYSYKGGTGRSMALANVAWILASNGCQVLVLDWDFEAPGLHRFFAPFLNDPTLADSEGMIDFFVRFAEEAATPREETGGEDDTPWFEPLADVLRYAASLENLSGMSAELFPSGGSVDFVPAGRQDLGYAHRCGAFDWDDFYERMGGGVFLEVARRRMREAYDYILIDSRTGVSDTSGICTAHLPDVLVTCFTANNQSIEGTFGITSSIRALDAGGPNRRGPSRILPLLTRVDTSEHKKLAFRQEQAQHRFESLVRAVAPLQNERSKYWTEMQVPYIPFYSYEEILAPFGDRPRKSGDFLSAMERLTGYITEGAIQTLGVLPDDETCKKILEQYEGRPAAAAPEGRPLSTREAAREATGPTLSDPPGERSPKRYDAYLSYNSLDRTVVERLAERLRSEGLFVYLDAWEMLPGQELRAAVAEALHASRTCVVFLGPSGLGPWQEEEIQVSLDRLAKAEELHVVPVLLPGAERPRRGDVAHLEFLLNASWVEFHRSIDDEASLGRLIWGITGTRPSTPARTYEGVCPYRGLEAFGPEDVSFFFGRENLTGWLTSSLRREFRTSRGLRFLAVLGPSGSGKSSIVLAGVVPALKRGAIEGSESWPIVIMRPGDDPPRNLAAAINARLITVGWLPVGQVLELSDRIIADERTLDEFARQALHDRPTDVRFVIVVDQFEDIFAYRPEDGEPRTQFERAREAFLANLLHAAAAPGGRVVVILTMRSNFLAACAVFPRLSAVLSAHQELVGPMTPAELREAIERPALVAGCEVEPALTERLLADVKGQPGTLPLLQFALTEVWKRCEGGRLTLRTYHELGGIEGAIETRADEIYKRFSPEEQDLCRRLFLRLVQPGEGAEDTRRRVTLHELLPDDPQRAETVRRLIQDLSDPDARLITADGDAVEVAHEALIRGWKQLRTWVDQERDGLRTQRRLTEAAQEWASAPAEHKDDYLLSGTRLAVAREWAAAHPYELSQAEAAFLGASEEAERHREQYALEAERLRADQEAENANRLRRRLYGMFGAMAATVAAASLAAYMWNDAKRQRDLADQKARTAEKSEIEEKKQRAIAESESKRALAVARIAESRRLAALSEAARSGRLDRALLLAVEAIRGDTAEAREALNRALTDSPDLRCFLHVPEGNVTSVAYGPGGELTAGFSTGIGERSEGGVAVFDPSGARTRTLHVDEGYVTGVAYGPGGAIAAGYSGSGKGVAVFDPFGTRARTLEIHEGEVSSVAYGPSGAIAAGYFDGKSGGVAVFDASGTRIRTLPVKRGEVTGLAWGPRDELAAGFSAPIPFGEVGEGGGVVVFDASGEPARTLDVTDGYVTSVAYGPSGALAAGFSAGGGGGVAVFDPSGMRTRTLEVEEGSVTGVAYGPSGALAAAYYDLGGVGGVAVFDALGLRARTLALQEGGVRSVAYGPGGALAAGYTGGVSGVAVFGSSKSRARTLEASEGNVVSVAYGPGGTLAAGYSDGGVGGVAVFDPSGARARSLEVKEGTVESVACGPNGTIAAGFSTGVRGGVAVFDPSIARAGTLEVDEGYVTGVAYGPGGVLAASYSVGLGQGEPGGGIAVFDASGARVGALKVSEGPATSVAYGPGGTLAAGFSAGGVGGVAVFDSRGARTRSLEVRAGAVTSVAYGPGGMLAAGYQIIVVGGGAGSPSSTPRARELAPWKWTRGRSRASPTGPAGRSPRDSPAGGAGWSSSTETPPPGFGKPGGSRIGTSRWWSGRSVSRMFPIVARSARFRGRTIYRSRTDRRRSSGRRDTPRTRPGSDFGGSHLGRDRYSRFFSNAVIQLSTVHRGRNRDKTPHPPHTRTQICEFLQLIDNLQHLAQIPRPILQERLRSCKRPENGILLPSTGLCDTKHCLVMGCPSRSPPGPRVESVDPCPDGRERPT